MQINAVCIGLLIYYVNRFFLLFFVSFSANFSLRLQTMEQQDWLQPSRRKDWVGHTGDQVTHLLEHTLFQDLPWYEIGGQTNFLVIYKHANSLYSLIADGQYRSTSLGRNAWKTLIGSQASLQPNCNLEGFNANKGDRARIGILGNNENDCNTCDSRIGFGSGGHPDNSNACGNVALHGGDNGDKYIKAHGYILVQWHS